MVDIAVTRECLMSECAAPGEIEAYSDFVTPDRAIYIMGPYRLCSGHAESLRPFMVELRYPDGTVEKPREPGEPFR
jgi:hypothetical protein